MELLLDARPRSVGTPRAARAAGASGRGRFNLLAGELWLEVDRYDEAHVRRSSARAIRLDSSALDAGRPERSRCSNLERATTACRPDVAQVHERRRRRSIARGRARFARHARNPLQAGRARRAGRTRPAAASGNNAVAVCATRSTTSICSRSARCAIAAGPASFRGASSRGAWSSCGSDTCCSRCPWRTGGQRWRQFQLSVASSKAPSCASSRSS